MPIEIKMPALSPTMEEGSLAKWLVKAGDSVKAGDILAEIETDKATMEFEAVDEGVIASIAVAEGTDGVKVGTVIATLNEEGEDASAPAAKAAPVPAPAPDSPSATEASAMPEKSTRTEEQAEDHGLPPQPGEKASAQRAVAGDRVKASPLARRIAAQSGIDLTSVRGSGPNGRIVRADVEGAGQSSSATTSQQETGPRLLPGKGEEQSGAPTAVAVKPMVVPEIPHEATKLSNMRKTIARRLTEAKQTVPHIYLTVDVQLDALLKLRAELNASLEARCIKLSVNDLLVKALGRR